MIKFAFSITYMYITGMLINQKKKSISFPLACVLLEQLAK